MKPFDTITPLEMAQIYKQKQCSQKQCSYASLSLLYSTTWNLMMKKIEAGEKLNK